MFAQLEKLDNVQKKRKRLWKKYYTELFPLSEAGKVQISKIPEYATNNGHLFYLVTKSEQDRNCLIKYLKSKGIHAVFHYLSLHKSQFYKKYQSAYQYSFYLYIISATNMFVRKFKTIFS